MVRHNNVVPNNHFKKKWQFYVRTWFNQAARKERRRNARAAKAAKVFPRPSAGLLRPVVRGQTLKYNSKQRLGKGFTLDELKEAGIAVRMASSLGIAVDHRRRNKSLESLQENVQRLKAYRSNLVVFPRNVKKPKAFETPLAEAKVVPQATGAVVMPIVRTQPALETVKVTSEMKANAGKELSEIKATAYAKLRLERTNVRLVGARAKKAKEAAKEEAA
ncbi:ribosomal protein L13 component of cytosolic 80S ribosome and 60S large subunit [Volvox carteri f. nagariensis]|uniref:60S ribosomal protein L13 n=1 Tax=Volvox carteri f. nagariensis TaxID=3068 RepID=D8U1M5_VOLCA|nr:ribosomal protein L13 component of cytosolic 80S ribosome and 60S large subunit [Volvox carteri f. nagariensis]EFJ46365.1 ribosomal protein L13 component of cytosolic 80S ribosome and 60S large subunit [Volvox carteri f. nagariensis]|eukprot:XP_002952518.1 ribosomal protein L13 component of cytosolic 80S ribosome and 60S large subunit [Volvox carteri f. nagariensis]